MSEKGNDRLIIQLKKLTMEQRRKQRMPDIYVGQEYDVRENLVQSCLPRNIKLVTREVNKELLEQGREPYDFEGGRCER